MLVAIHAPILRPYVPDIPWNCNLITVPHSAPKLHFSASSREPQIQYQVPKIEKPQVKISFGYKNKFGERIRDTDREVIPIKELSARKDNKVKETKVLKIPSVERIAFAETDLTPQRMEEIISEMKTGNYPVILLGEKGASVYPHPRMFVTPSPNNTYHNSKFTIQVKKLNPIATTDQFEAFEIDEYYREVSISPPSITGINHMGRSELDPLHGVLVPRFPGLVLNELSPNERAHLVVKSATGELQP